MEPLKDQYNKVYVDYLANTLKEIHADFRSDDFVKSVFNDAWKDMELKPRLRHITLSLHRHLPPSYEESIDILKKAAPGFSGFHAMFFPDFVEVFGMEFRVLSLNALEYFTQFSSSEFAIRPFIIADPEGTMERMLLWSQHENEHVRRLSTEGCRPRLPWAMALPDFKKDPGPILPILENLKNDPSEYVRRSVANNLNDISKDHPALVLEIAKKWMGRQANTDKLVKHACRTMLKSGNQQALALFGFNSAQGVKVTDFKVDPEILRIGETMRFSFQLYIDAGHTQQVRTEFGVYYKKANGSHSRKVFRIGEKELKPNRPYTYSKKHDFRDLTTRKHHPGEHKLSLIVNGEEIAEASFELKK